VVDTTSYAHVGKGQAIAGTFNGASGTGLTQVNQSAEFIADSGITTTVIGASMGTQATLSASSSNYCAPYGLCGSSELTYALPIPFAYALGSLNFSTQGTVATANATVHVNVNGSNTNLTGTISSSDTQAAQYNDYTHTYTGGAAGDYVDFLVATGASTQPTLTGWYLGVTSSASGPFLIGTMISGTVTTTANYYSPMAAGAATSQTQHALPSPRTFTVSNLYVSQAALNGGGVTTTISVCDYTTSSCAVSGSLTSASLNVGGSNAPGIFALDLTDTMTISQGDVFTFKAVSTGGTSGAIGGIAAQGQ
jgi:hypothetical protein